MKLELKQALTLAELAHQIEVQLPESVRSSSDEMITHLAVLDKATKGCVSFLSNPVYKKFLNTTEATAVIVNANDAKECPGAALICKDPRLALAKLLHLCKAAVTATATGVHPTAVIGNNVTLGENVTIGPNCNVGDNCVIGANSTLMAGVTVYHSVVIGARCTIHSNSVIGSDGFGFAMDPKSGWIKMLHLGSVVIGDDVEIGSNTSIDRGMLDNTIIGNNVIIDNLVQIGHNVVIGDRTAIAGCAGIAGSTSIGKNCLIGGASCINGHIVIGDNVIVTGTSSVNHSLLEPGVYSSGFPARENSVWRRNVARFMFLDDMAKRIKDLEKQVDKINE